MRNWDSITEEKGLLYREVRINNISKKPLLLALLHPLALLDQVLQALHDNAGHQGTTRTLQLARERCYWPTMVQDIERHCSDCPRCTLAKAGKKVHSSLGSLIARRPLEVLAIDFTVLEKGHGGLENVLVLTDIFTKYTQAVPCKDQTAKTVAAVLVRCLVCQIWRTKSNQAIKVPTLRVL